MVQSAARKGKKQRAKVIEERLANERPNPVVELDFKSAWELLVATILAAQSTDKMINTITPVLFSRWPGPRELAGAELGDVEEVVKSSGFYRNKAKAIVNAAQAIVAMGGEVPTEIERLVTVPGVGRKTANVVLGSAYRIASGMVVDTHVTRVAGRLGLTTETDPEKIEDDLCKLFPRSSWIDTSHRLVLHGRYVCKAKKPACGACVLAEVCPSAEV
ncbi:MAG TPA: endonuclease III [Myxococcota bacterium]|nr:endonuclease III [Myxococcota bacterium]